MVEINTSLWSPLWTTVDLSQSLFHSVQSWLSFSAEESLPIHARIVFVNRKCNLARVHWDKTMFSLTEENFLEENLFSHKRMFSFHPRECFVSHKRLFFLTQENVFFFFTMFAQPCLFFPSTPPAPLCWQAKNLLFKWSYSWELNNKFQHNDTINWTKFLYKVQL